MLNNLVNRHDLTTLAERGPALLAQILRRLLSSAPTRTCDTWSHTSRLPTAWNDIPAVRERWNIRVSDDPRMDFRQYVLARHLPVRDGLQALSLGCGSGAQEPGWAGSARLARLEAWDLSPARIAHARVQAREAGLERTLHFRAGDIVRMPVREPALRPDRAAPYRRHVVALAVQRHRAPFSCRRTANPALAAAMLRGEGSAHGLRLHGERLGGGGVLARSGCVRDDIDVSRQATPDSRHAR